MSNKWKRAIVLMARKWERTVLLAAIVIVPIVCIGAWLMSDFVYACGGDTIGNCTALMLIAGVGGLAVGILAGGLIAVRVSRTPPGWTSAEW